MAAGTMHLRRAAFAPSLLSISAVCFALSPAGCSAEATSRENTRAGAQAYSIPDPSDFSLPPSSASARAAIVARYAQLDPGGVVPRGLLEDAVEYFDVNSALIPNKAYITIVDFSKFSGNDRFFIVDMTSGDVESHKVAHGQNSDPNWTGWATKFSNVSGSLESSLGFYMGGEIYDGSHPHSMRLDGLSPDGSPNHMANTNVRDRAVVMHEATYVDDSNTGKQGRSDGCLALDPNIEKGVVERLANGSLIYAETAPLNPPVGTAGGGSSSGGSSGSSSSGSSSGSSGGGGGTPCSTDGDCNPGSDGSGQICVGGFCVAGCNADWECPGSTSCVSGTCQ
ncbi:MAG TPA: murein L,D-transpeptidase catalytic domain family protein [Polyangiaceae bacterium]|nr:murein L,D-transpeptidase catalytic domain family protein [Polyangiaceae bacterium]